MKFQSLAGEEQRQRARRQRAISLLAPRSGLPAVFFCSHLTPVFSSNSLSSLSWRDRSPVSSETRMKIIILPSAVFSLKYRACTREKNLSGRVCMHKCHNNKNKRRPNQPLSLESYICITHIHRRCVCVCVTMDRAERSACIILCTRISAPQTMPQTQGARRRLLYV
jgi:hypothetical protein